MFDKLFKTYEKLLLYRPWVYYWKVTYPNGKSIAQFDENGNEILYGNVSKKDALIIGWYPFDIKLARKLLDKGLLVLPKQIPSHEIILEKGEEPIIFRRNYIALGANGGRRIKYILGKKHKFLWIIDENGNKEVKKLID